MISIQFALCVFFMHTGNNFEKLLLCIPVKKIDVN